MKTKRSLWQELRFFASQTMLSWAWKIMPQDGSAEAHIYNLGIENILDQSIACHEGRVPEHCMLVMHEIEEYQQLRRWEKESERLNEQLHQALASLKAIEKAEPVAWRVKDFADGWILCDTEEGATALAASSGGALVQRLIIRPDAQLSRDTKAHAYREERNRILKSGDINGLRKLVGFGADIPDATVEMAMHKARYDCCDLPDGPRRASQTWLYLRNLTDSMGRTITKEDLNSPLPE